MVISPELADVLAAIVARIRDPHGAVPLIMAYDTGERIWNPPMPLLFQHRVAMENRPFGTAAVGRLVTTALTAAGLTGPSGRQPTFAPHDFRRILSALFRRRDSHMGGRADLRPALFDHPLLAAACG